MTALAKIEELRAQIDDVDTALLHVLARRLSLVAEIGRHKQLAGIGVVQPGRWRRVLEQRLDVARCLDLRADFVLALFELIHDEALRVQDALGETRYERAVQ